jgi:hypothetical protein
MLVLQGTDDVTVLPENAKRLAVEFPDRVTLVEIAQRATRCCPSSPMQSRRRSSPIFDADGTGLQHHLVRIKRREFIALLGTVAASALLAAVAQRTTPRVVGFLAPHRDEPLLWLESEPQES